jgi:hypothetical protein
MADKPEPEEPEDHATLRRIVQEEIGKLDVPGQVSQALHDVLDERLQPEDGGGSAAGAGDASGAGDGGGGDAGGSGNGGGKPSLLARLMGG